MIKSLQSFLLFCLFATGLSMVFGCAGPSTKPSDQAMSQSSDQPQKEAKASTPVDQQLSEVSPVEVEQNKVRVRLDDAFNPATDDLKPEAARKLIQIGAILSEDPNRQIQVESYTDSVGNSKENQLISERRARKVESLLIETGVKADQILVAGLGETHPIASNLTEEGQEMNRRVEILVQAPTA